MTHLHALASTGPLTGIQDQQASLLIALAKGDRTAFWSLWRSHDSYLYRRCLQWMNYRRYDADEALSRAMVRAWEKLPHYADQIQNLKGWLSQLTYRVCMDFYRENQRISYSLDESSRESFDHYDKLASDEDSPDCSLQRCELSSVIQAAIASLPDRLREPCRLRLCDNWTYSQLALHFQISEPTARKRIQQARAILRRRITLYLSGQRSGRIETLGCFDQRKVA